MIHSIENIDYNTKSIGIAKVVIKKSMETVYVTELFDSNETGAGIYDQLCAEAEAVTGLPIEFLRITADIIRNPKDLQKFLSANHDYKLPQSEKHKFDCYVVEIPYSETTEYALVDIHRQKRVVSNDAQFNAEIARYCASNKEHDIFDPDGKHCVHIEAQFAGEDDIFCYVKKCTIDVRLRSGEPLAGTSANQEG